MNSACQLDSVCLVAEKAMYDEEQWDSFFFVWVLFLVFLPFEQRVGSGSFELSHHTSFDCCNLYSPPYLLNVRPSPRSWSWWYPTFSTSRGQGRCWFSLSASQESWTFSSSAFGKPDIPWPGVNSPVLFSLHRTLFSVWKKELRIIQN